MQCPVDPTSEETKDDQSDKNSESLAVHGCAGHCGRGVAVVGRPRGVPHRERTDTRRHPGRQHRKIAPNAIVVQAIGLGLSIPTSSTPGGGQTIGRATVEPFKIAKFLDKASPKLLLAALTNESLKVDLTWFGADLAGTPVAKTFSITLEGAIIVGIETSGATTVANGVTEEISFIFNKITFRDERTSPAITTCWDLVLNRKC